MGQERPARKKSHRGNLYVRGHIKREKSLRSGHCRSQIKKQVIFGAAGRLRLYFFSAGSSQLAWIISVARSMQPCANASEVLMLERALIRIILWPGCNDSLKLCNDSFSNLNS